MRYRIIYFVIAVFSFLTLSRLVDMQLVRGEYYSEQSRQKLVKTSTISAPRGEILDRNGKALVKNKTGFSVEIHYVKNQSDSERNLVIARLYNEISKAGQKIYDSFPLSADGKSFAVGEGEVKEWKKGRDFDENITADGVMEHYTKLYGVESFYTPHQKRAIVGVRYEMERTAFSSNNPYLLANDVPQSVLTTIKEKNDMFGGVVVSVLPVREYTMGTTMAHILGRVGKIYKEEYEALEGDNYSLNDVIGKKGIEKYFEKYLRGQDGVSGIEQSIDGRRVKIVESVAPVSGNNVLLTIDANLQRVAESALEKGIERVKELSEYEPENAGEDAASGALAAIDVNTGEILALASFPSFNPATFNDDYNALSRDKNLPMFNRAIGGAYEPGSTFKMVTALAALEEGIVKPNDFIEDVGIYKHYKDYRPACWIYRSKNETHGYQNVTQALENSCNYYFYDVGRRTGIESINKYAIAMGLGESTGIELENEENRGRLTSPEEREKNGQTWNPGDVLQVAIGQSDNMFTPLQMANYIATLANGGTRYTAHLVKNIRNPRTGEMVYEAGAEALSKIDISAENLKAVLGGMKNVTELGTASDVFEDFNVAVGGKTGTAEVSDGSDNAIFVGFAPFDQPQIAVCAVIEHGAHGANAGYVVREVLDEYFNAPGGHVKVNKKNVLVR